MPSRSVLATIRGDLDFTGGKVVIGDGRFASGSTLTTVTGKEHRRRPPLEAMVHDPVTGRVFRASIKYLDESLEIPPPDYPENVGSEALVECRGEVATRLTAAREAVRRAIACGGVVPHPRKAVFVTADRVPAPGEANDGA